MNADMKADQISVFLENRAGQLAEVIHTLAEAKFNIRALSLADTSDFGILRMIVCDQQNAEATLRDKGFTLGRATVVAVEMVDQPGSLDTILQLVSKNGINVEYMYAFAQRSLDKAVMIFRFDKVDEAINVLTQNNFTLIPAKMLCNF